MILGLLHSFKRSTQHFSPQRLPFARQLQHHAAPTPLAALTRVLRQTNGATNIRVPKLVNRAERQKERQQVLEAMFSMLTSHHHYEEATVVYDKLRSEGYVLSPLTDAKLCAIALSTSALAPEHEHVVFSLANIFSSSAFTETDLVHYIALVRGMGFTPNTCVTILKTFIATREGSFKPSSGTLKLLLGLQAEAGIVNEALELVSQLQSHQPAPYLSILGNIDPLDSKSLDTVLATMRRQQVETDSRLFNVLIVRACHSLQMHQAFHLYRYLASLSKESPVRPSIRAYRALFDVLRQSYKPGYQAPRYRRHSRDDRLVMSPRALYKDLLTVHEFHPSNWPQERAVLTAAFNCFVAKKDYSAAYVVLKSFSMFRFPINVVPYRTLLKHLRRKLTAEVYIRMGAKRGTKSLRSMLRSRDRGSWTQWERTQKHRDLLVKRVRMGHAATFPWSRRMVETGPKKVREKLKDPQFPTALMRLEAGLGAEDRSVVDPASQSGTTTNSSWRKPNRYVVPSRAQLDAVKIGVMAFSAVPLQRLLRRAIAAEREELHGLFKSKKEATETVSKKIKSAKVAMLSL